MIENQNGNKELQYNQNQSQIQVTTHNGGSNSKQCTNWQQKLTFNGQQFIFHARLKNVLS